MMKKTTKFIAYLIGLIATFGLIIGLGLRFGPEAIHDVMPYQSSQEKHETMMTKQVGEWMIFIWAIISFLTLVGFLGFVGLNGKKFK